MGRIFPLPLSFFPLLFPMFLHLVSLSIPLPWFPPLILQCFFLFYFHSLSHVSSVASYRPSFLFLSSFSLLRFIYIFFLLFFLAFCTTQLFPSRNTSLCLFPSSILSVLHLSLPPLPPRRSLHIVALYSSILFVPRPLNPSFLPPPRMSLLFIIHSAFKLSSSITVLCSHSSFHSLFLSLLLSSRPSLPPVSSRLPAALSPSSSCSCFSPRPTLVSSNPFTRTFPPVDIWTQFCCASETPTCLVHLRGEEGLGEGRLRTVRKAMMTVKQFPSVPASPRLHITPS